MSAPRDRLLPEGIPNALADKLPQLAAAPVMLTLRRKGCGCPLGLVRRLAGVGDVFVGEPRSLVREEQGRRARRRQRMVVLQSPHMPILELRCAHGRPAMALAGLEDEQLMAFLLERVAEVARGDTPKGKPLLL